MNNPGCTEPVISLNTTNAPPVSGEPRVKLTARNTGAACVRCDGTLEIAEILGHKIAACRSCQGRLIETRIFADIVAALRSQPSVRESNVQPVDQGELKERSQCVVCLGNMDTHLYGGPGNVVIDTCCRCHLVWLDGKELQRISQAPGR